MTTHTAAPHPRPSPSCPDAPGLTHACCAHPAAPHDHTSRVVAAADHMLAQCESFLADLPPVIYPRESTLMPGGSVGKHVRHCLDHYAALHAALHAGVIDYDHRERDVPAERDPAAARDIVRGLRLWLSALGADAPGAPVRVRVMVSAAGDTAELDSTLARELAFATHHAVHHFAMLRVIAAEFGVALHPDFGKAPSTVHALRGAHTPAH